MIYLITYNGYTVFAITWDLGLSNQKLLIKLSIDANEKDKTYFEHSYNECKVYVYIHIMNVKVYVFMDFLIC